MINFIEPYSNPSMPPSLDEILEYVRSIGRDLKENHQHELISECVRHCDDRAIENCFLNIYVDRSYYGGGNNIVNVLSRHLPQYHQAMKILAEMYRNVRRMNL